MIWKIFVLSAMFHLSSAPIHEEYRGCVVEKSEKLRYTTSLKRHIFR